MSVIRRVRHPGAPETRYAMPLSHSHQFLCVPPSPPTMTVSRPGAAGLVTSQISCAVLPNALLVDDRLIGAPALQVVIADQLHVLLFRLCVPRLRGRASVHHDTQRAE